MTEFNFLLKFDLLDPEPDPDKFVDALYEAGCDDAVIGIGQHGRVALSFTREAASGLEAIASAISDVKKAIPEAKLVEITPDWVAKYLNATPERWLCMKDAVGYWNLTPYEKEILDSLVDQMHKTSEDAISAIDSALYFVDASNKRITKMDSHKNEPLSATTLKGMITKPSSPVSIEDMNNAINSQGEKPK